ncbi:MAG: peptidoglycan-binding protein [Myxococcales bacterium]|nr:peptidoglycan-binding protein [Myxococcales bacterium]
MSLKSAQLALKRLGYDPGPVDDVYGQRTRSALTRFQRAKHLPVSGTLDDETLRLLAPRSEATAP